MQNIPTGNTVSVLCAGCVSFGRFQGSYTNVPRQEDNCNTIKLINSNFLHITETNKQMNSQIVDCNKTITALNEHVNKLEEKIKSLNETIEKNNTSQQEMKDLNHQLNEHITNVDKTINVNTKRIIGTEREIKSLVRKVDIVVTYIPTFVKNVSKWFVNLLLGIKTNTLDNMEFVYDTKMIEAL